MAKLKARQPVSQLLLLLIYIDTFSFLTVFTWPAVPNHNYLYFDLDK